MRSFFSIPLEGYGHAYCCAVTGGIDLKPTANQLYAFLHAGNADTNFEPRLFLCSWHTDRGSVAAVADFQRKIRVAINPYFGLLTSRMALDVCEGLLHYTK